jgi:hypothetical protein
MENLIRKILKEETEDRLKNFFRQRYGTNKRKNKVLRSMMRTCFKKLGRYLNQKIRDTVYGNTMLITWGVKKIRLNEFLKYLERTSL